MTGAPEPDGAAPRAFARGTLWRRTEQRTRSALASGALEPIAARCVVVEQAGAAFLVRVLDGPDRKEAAGRTIFERTQRPPPPGFDPFGPPEPQLVVAEVSPTHLAVLNKFPVLAQHLVLVTRAFEEQDSPLSPADFEALWLCLAEAPALGFYNSGAVAGASQRHKHLQLVPLPLAPGAGRDLPVEPLLAGADEACGEPIGTAPGLPFAHALARLPPACPAADPLQRACRSHELYLRLLRHGGCMPGPDGVPPPYNLLVTAGWMLLVPRSRARFQGISVNALGFAGALLVRDEHELDLLRDTGPLELLRRVCFERSDRR